MSGLEVGSGREKRVCVRKGGRFVDGALRPKEREGEGERGGEG